MKWERITEAFSSYICFFFKGTIDYYLKPTRGKLVELTPNDSIRKVHNHLGLKDC